MNILLLFLEYLAKRCQHKGRLHQAHQWVSIALTLIRDASGEKACHFRNIRAFLWYLQGEKDRFLREIEMVLFMSNIGEYQAEIAQCHALTGIYLQDTQKQPKHALQWYRSSLQLREELGQKESCAKMHNHIGMAHKELEEFEEAEKHFHAALSLTRDPRVQININLERGRLERERKRLNVCDQYLYEALRKSTERFPNETGDCFREFSRLATDRAQHQDAMRYAAKAIGIYDKHGYRAKVDAMIKELREKGYLTANLKKFEEKKDTT